MKKNIGLLKLAGAALLGCFCLACGGETSRHGEGALQLPGVVALQPPGEGPGQAAATISQASAAFSRETLGELERLAELERGGSFSPGMGFYESGLKEEAGDFAWAVFSVYKELSWAYSYGSLTKVQLEEGLINALAALNDPLALDDMQAGAAPEVDRAGAALALRGCMAFFLEDWEEAGWLLSAFSGSYDHDEPDSFLSWMLLTTALEQEPQGDAAFRLRSY